MAFTNSSLILFQGACPFPVAQVSPYQKRMALPTSLGETQMFILLFFFFCLSKVNQGHIYSSPPKLVLSQTPLSTSPRK